MFSFRTTPLDRQEDVVLRKGRLGVLCNQSAWNPETGEYLFESLSRRGNLKKIFYPASGIFGELDADFTSLPGDYSCMGLSDCEFVPLQTGAPLNAALLGDIDALIVEYQDTGSRYDSMTALLHDIFRVIDSGTLPVSVYVLDRENICGRWVEGTAVEGITHRHGLTVGELANLFYSELGARFPLHIISYMVRPANQYLMPWSIPPRPDVPGLFTASFYCGMVLLSGTDLSYGGGTSRPYELFGAPYMECYLSQADVSGFSDAGVFLRKTVFTPRFGRYKDEVCYGFQMLPRPGVPYHSTAHALRIMRQLVADGLPVDTSGFLSVAGDDVMDSYVKGVATWTELKEHIKVEEQKWIRKARRYMLYDEQLMRVKTFRTINN
ncbi:MAG TPA: DUF1343 domain-containing protein [Candidatus Coprenecus pullicola]|nr:DUF1343 domain-containing protein [Candidatus Coprenecus pullicola]